jgi:hypothetical protein
VHHVGFTVLTYCMLFHPTCSHFMYTSDKYSQLSDSFKLAAYVFLFMCSWQEVQCEEVVSWHNSYMELSVACNNLGTVVHINSCQGNLLLVSFTYKTQSSQNSTNFLTIGSLYIIYLYIYIISVTSTILIWNIFQYAKYYIECK